MKIGILTLPLHTNYGGILQAYALQTVLEKMGHEVWIIKSPRRDALPLFKKPLVYTKRFVLKYILGKDIVLNQERKNLQERIMLQTHTRMFVNKNLHIKHYANLDDIKENDFNAIIVGSDQIWRSKYIKILITDKVENAFLYFTKGWDIKRIAYAASFGTETWEYTKHQTKRCQQGITMFDAVSVRETSGIDLCLKKLKTKAEVVVDPTLLLTRNDYVNLIKDSKYKVNGELMTYILDEHKIIHNLIEQVSMQTGWRIFSSNKKVNDRIIPVEERIQPPVENWLIGFRDAQFVITDSFHACVFSIIFNKPFLVIGNEERGMSRFLSLLKMFGQEQRLIKQTKDFKLKDWHLLPPNVNLEKFRKSSITYLEKSLAQ